MLLVETFVKSSGIHGLGCFAGEKISRGQVVWVFDRRIDRRIPRSELPAFPAAIQNFLRMYGYVESHDGTEVIVLCGDNSRHMNHDADPNLLEDKKDGSNVAARDIEVGEELTCNYLDFDGDAHGKLG